MGGKSTRVNLSVYCNEQLNQQIRRYAERRGISISTAMIELITKGLWVTYNANKRGRSAPVEEPVAGVDDADGAE